MAPASTHGEHFAEVVLVRHGQTDWNVSRIIQGGGESLDQLSERLVPRLNAIAEKHKGERVVVVSHEAVIEEICRHADPTISVGRKIPNTSISVVHISGSDGRWILEKFGDAGHLIGDGFPQSTL
uniref:Uncharacterized protein n=1 Tax=Setaria italica TaxID=4555 RepID=K3ZNX5_SETIT